MLRGGNHPEAWTSRRARTEHSVWPCPSSKGSVSSVWDLFPVVPFLPWPPASCKRHFFLKGEQVIAFTCWLDASAISLLHGWRAVGAESFPTGKPGCVQVGSGHTGPPATKPVEMERWRGRAGASQAQGHLLSSLPPPPMHSHLAPLTQGGGGQQTMAPCHLFS